MGTSLSYPTYGPIYLCISEREIETNNKAQIPGGGGGLGLGLGYDQEFSKYPFLPSNFC